VNCPRCGAEVKRCVTRDGDAIVLDAAAREYRGPDRYIIEGTNLAIPVAPSFEAYAYGDHSKTCPHAVIERERRERR
jgi:hypothetical protein